MRQEQDRGEDPAEGGHHPPRPTELPPRRRDSASSARHHAARLAALKERQPHERHGCEGDRLDHRHPQVAVQLRRDDLGRHHPESAAENVGRREGRERRHEREERRSRQNRAEERQRDPNESPAPARAQRRGGLEERSVQPGQPRAGEQVEVHVHRVRVHEENGGRPREAPRRLLEVKEGLDPARDETALAVEKQKRDDSHERRQDDRQRDERAEHAPARELRALEEKRERNADAGGECDRYE